MRGSWPALRVRGQHPAESNARPAQQKASFFNCLLDMAAGLGGAGSRAGSLCEGSAPPEAPDAPEETQPLAAKGRRNTARNRSLR